MSHPTNFIQQIVARAAADKEDGTGVVTNLFASVRFHHAAGGSLFPAKTIATADPSGKAKDVRDPPAGEWICQGQDAVIGAERVIYGPSKVLAHDVGKASLKSLGIAAGSIRIKAIHASLIHGTV